MFVQIENGKNLERLKLSFVLWSEAFDHPLRMEALEASICVYEEQLKQVEASILATAPTSDEELVNLKNGENDICTILYTMYSIPLTQRSNKTPWHCPSKSPCLTTGMSTFVHRFEAAYWFVKAEFAWVEETTAFGRNWTGGKRSVSQCTINLWV